MDSAPGELGALRDDAGGIALSRLASLQAVYDEWERGNYRAGIEIYDDAMTLEVHNPIPEAGVYDGLEGLQRYMRRFLATWDEYEIRGVEFEDLGDRIVVLVHHKGTTGGATVEMDYTTVWTFTGDRVTRVDIGPVRT
jgi:ketosteroid isomerase-like protein